MHPPTPAAVHAVPSFQPLPTYQPGRAIPGASANGVLGPDGIQAWRHDSGVRVVLFAAPGPLVSATIVVGTEPISDAGHPHTLEHIIFLGSHNYPTRGYLDNLACRCLADGTNAWTCVEYTAYTTTTAGFEGFSQLLPCFLDHIMRPNIHHAAFASEVYHLREDGKEAGVVFCEMQARENTEDDLSDRAVRNALFNGTPLAFESGGLCAQIRKLRNEDIVNFHASQYCAANITVVVGGSNIDSSVLLQSIKPVLDDIAAQPSFSPGSPRWQKPLQLKPLPPVTKKIIPFPCPDQDIGTVIFAWRAPGALQRVTLFAIDVLFTYLASDVWSPLRQAFVETEDQLASDVFHSIDVFKPVSTISLSFEGVNHLEEDEEEEEEEECAELATEDVDESEDEEAEQGYSLLTSGEFEQKVITVLKDIVDNGEIPGGLNAIHTILKREKETFLADLEASSHETVPYHMIEEIAYGEQSELPIGYDIRGNLEFHAQLQAKDEGYWIQLLRDCVVEAPRVEIVMVPDAELATSIAEAENAAVAERVATLGEDTLRNIGKENQARIESLKKGNFDADTFPPLPSTMNVSRWSYSVSRAERDSYTAQSVSLETDFVHCSIFLDTKSLSVKQRILLPLLCDLIPTCDILLEDGSYIPYTDSARAISEATVSTDMSKVSLGCNNSLAHQCSVIHFAAMPDSFEEACNLMMQTLFQGEITAERLAAASQSILANTTANMRDGSSVLSGAVAVLPFLHSKGDWKGETPNYVFTNTFGVHPLVSFLAEEFSKKKPRKQLQRNILKKMSESLDALRQLPRSDIFVQIAARDPETAHNTFAAAWSEKKSTFIARAGLNMKEETVKDSPKKMLKDDTKLPLSRRICGTLAELMGGGSVSQLIGISGVDSSCVEIRVDSPIFAGHAEWSSLFVLTEILCRMEGQLVNAVRGAGLAYGVYLSNSVWRGHLVLSIYESSAPAAAWDAICEALEAFRADLDKDAKETGLATELDTAKSSTLFELIAGRSTPESITSGVLSRSAVGAPASPLADQSLEEAIEQVSLASLAKVYDSHIARLMKPENRLVAVTCGQGVAKETIAAFKKCSRPIELEECPVETLFSKDVQNLVKSLKKS